MHMLPYASIDEDGDDSVSHESNKKLLQEEVVKRNPKSEVKELIRRTFTNRHCLIINNCKAIYVSLNCMLLLNYEIYPNIGCR